MKFVIHFHETENAHYDLMIERDDTLVTWRIETGYFEMLLDGCEIKAERIQDHRKIYLSYEGPISCNRGRIKSYDTGDYTVRSWSESEIEIVAAGTKISGDLYIKKTGGKIFSIKLMKH